MIGNDIVDLKEAKKMSNWQRSRFLEKLFTDEEQQHITSAENPFVKVWQFWSMKEAAYKGYVQLYPNRFFNPKSFKCHVNNSSSKVSFGYFECEVVSEITSEYILTKTQSEDKNMFSEVIDFPTSDYRTQHNSTKKLLFKSLSDLFKHPQSDFNIKKSMFGIPQIYLKDIPLQVGVSMSHHGRFGAIAILT